MDALARVEQLRHLSTRPWEDPWRARQALASASDTVRGYCGWWLAPVLTATAVLSGDGSPILGLPCTRVLEVRSVRLRGVTVVPAAYEWSPVGQLERTDGGGFPRGLANVEVEYVGGYDEVPDSVVSIVCALADTLDLPTGIASQSIEDQAVTYTRGSDDATGLTKNMARILDRGFVVPPRA